MDGCPFCESTGTLRDDIVARNEHCLLVRGTDPVLRSSMMVLPVRHAETPFDLTAEEWGATREMLAEARRVLEADGPDGYSVGWNVHPVGGQSVPHAHLHVIGRFADEPLAGKGIRHALKQPSNRRRTAPKET
jgi:histidine triad (HIT) family protein